MVRTYRQKGKIMLRKAGSFARGTLEGFLAIFVLPTTIRKSINNEFKLGANRESGYLVGSMLNTVGVAVTALSLKEDVGVVPLIFVGLTNAVSGTYETGRYVVRRVMRNRSEE